MTRIASLAGFIADKATQARKIVQWTHIEPLMAKTNILFYLGLRFLDGKDTAKRMLEYLYEIQAGAYLVGAIEDNEVKKRLAQRKVDGKPKRRKHYGFDTRAVAHIDILCDEMSRFVDDIAVGVKNVEQAQIIRRAVAEKAAEMGLTLHPRKFYLQPSHRGVTMCGYTVKGRRLYLNNRTLHACKVAVKATEPSLEGARRIVATVNSYLGFLRHCTEYKNERRIASAVLEKFGAWVYFRERCGHFVCVLKQKYNERQNALNRIKMLKYEFQRFSKESLCEG